ncbi:hypothetical protein PIB30_084489 [Stylosanthes scabra]|uniref:Putative plant transposon protein domain-containing protein n=1 Tax=Stylosanthes scabra TaxID=79078 RepID=A0ABU6WVC2_9FABA|nr:hypothetical protein [Stylosanthes scabra]
MASSSSTTDPVDEHCFRALFNQNLFEEIVCRKKVTPEVSFDLEDDKYLAIREQIALRGWRRLASPRTKISRRVLRFKEQTPEAETDYATRQRMDQRINEVLPDLCITGATWKLGSSQPAQPIQLRRAELTPLARGWHEFIIHSIIPTGNRFEITIARAILIHSIIKGKDVRPDELIADNIAIIAQGMQGKGTLAFPSTIYKLCKDSQVPLYEFRGTELIPQDKLITARLMETTRLGSNVQVQQQQNEE